MPASGKLGSASLTSGLLTAVYICPTTGVTCATVNILVANGSYFNTSVSLAVSTATVSTSVVGKDYITPRNLILAPTDGAYEIKGIVITSGETVWAQASATGTTVRVHGFEQ